ncbi:MAG: MarC family protein [candidate division KSB1 bacterium]|nr:MarC family protein [candidate division KSB1 bacterium]MDZ7274869.1 MarC family protein [candidate division KSB1 bacterium]MDZ7286679.1 MarC family protein [candidate division KSB1 bacterium]MDZ7299158.1 MarC family protein [candidate division KSB1 bacterium]MDZ7350022.1 MarC family protein [candidate division KSB1 bacterium]
MLAFALNAFVAVLVITDPLGNVPIFASLLNDYRPEQRHAIIRRACLVGVLILTLFALMGGFILKMFGITIGAFRIAGGLILFGIAMNMLAAQKSRVHFTPSEQEEAHVKDDIAIVPLAIPLISGPGAIATVMTLTTQAQHFAHLAIIIAAILFAGTLSYVIYHYAGALLLKMGETGINLMTRLLGLILAVMAVQFVINGVKDSFPEIFGK